MSFGLDSAHSKEDCWSKINVEGQRNVCTVVLNAVKKCDQFVQNLKQRKQCAVGCFGCC